MQMQLQLQAQAQHDGQHTATHAVRDSDFHRATKADRQTDAIRSVSFRFSIRPDPIRSVSNRKQTKAIPILTQNDPHFFSPGQLTAGGLNDRRPTASKTTGNLRGLLWLDLC